MKNNIFIPILIIFGVFISLVSCQKQLIQTDSIALPTIFNPTYKSYSIKGERGYTVSFELAASEPKPIAVVFNKIQKEIVENEIHENNFHVNIMAQSAIIEGFKPKASELPNGILFRINDTLYLKTVDFKKIHQ